MLGAPTAPVAGAGTRPFYADGKMQDERGGELAEKVANDLLRKVGPAPGPVPAF